MDWTDMLGHADVIGRVRSLIADDTFPHAAIFSGIRGTGKFTLARLTAEALLCSERKVAPCGKCPSCRAFDKGMHPDLFVLKPDVSVKNPAIKVGQVREMLSGIALEPMLSDLRVILIDEAHTMNAVSQNSILKTIEEPVGRSVFILVTNRRSDLLITIRSRCLTFGFDRLSTEEIMVGLRARGLDESIAELADGSLGRALQLSEEGGLELRAKVFDVLNRIDRLSIEELLSTTEELAKSPRGVVSDWLTYFIQFLRDMLTVDLGARLYNADLRDALSARRATLGERRIFAFFDLALEMQRRLSSNADLRLLCDSFFIGLRRSV